MPRQPQHRIPADHFAREYAASQSGLGREDQPDHAMRRSVCGFRVSGAAHDPIAKRVVGKAIDPNVLHPELIDHRFPRFLVFGNDRSGTVYRQLSLCDGRATSLTPYTAVSA